MNSFQKKTSFRRLSIELLSVTLTLCLLSIIIRSNYFFLCTTSLIFFFVVFKKTPTFIEVSETYIHVGYYALLWKKKSSCALRNTYYVYQDRTEGRGMRGKHLELYFCNEKVAAFTTFLSGWDECSILEIKDMLSKNGVEQRT
jgi:hypothetical protein